jgi:hypothetical protein
MSRTSTVSRSLLLISGANLGLFLVFLDEAKAPTGPRLHIDPLKTGVNSENLR